MVNPHYICDLCKAECVPAAVKGLSMHDQHEDGKLVSRYIIKAPHMSDIHVCQSCLDSLAWLLRREAIKDMIVKSAPVWGEKGGSE